MDRLPLPAVPDGLAGDLSSNNELFFCFSGESGGLHEIAYSPGQTLAPPRIEYRPFLVIEYYAAEGIGKKVVAIPFEAVASIDVDTLESRGEGACHALVNIPLARWVNHPDKGLQRFCAPEE